MPGATLTRTLNGVDVARLRENIELLKQQPNLADFRFRVTNQWLGGGHSRSVVQDFKGVGEENRHTRRFEFDADEPEVLLGRDLGANPVEHLLAAVTACVTSALVYHAAARGIEITHLESRTEGHIDLRGFLGIDDSIPRGYQRIQITFRIEADVPDEELAELVKLGPTYSPVYDTVTRAVPVDVDFER